MEKIRFLPLAMAALVVAALVAVRFISLNSPPREVHAVKPVVASNPAPTPAPAMPAKAQHPVMMPLAIPITNSRPGTDPAPVLKDPKETPAASANPANAGDPKWEVVYKDDFDKPESIKKYALETLSDPPSELLWHEKHKAMM